MRRFNTFLIILLIVLAISLIFIVQNSGTTVDLKFLGWTFSNISVGLTSILIFIIGFIAMWIISIMIYLSGTSRYRKEVSEMGSVIKKLEEEKTKLKEDYDKLLKDAEDKKREFEFKTKELEEKIKSLEEEIKVATTPEGESPSPPEVIEAEEPPQEQKKKKGLFHRG